MIAFSRTVCLLSSSAPPPPLSPSRYRPLSSLVCQRGQRREGRRAGGREGGREGELPVVKRANEKERGKRMCKASGSSKNGWRDGGREGRKEYVELSFFAV